MPNPAAAAPHRIDVHHHLLPPRYVAETLDLRPGEHLLEIELLGE